MQTKLQLAALFSTMCFAYGEQPSKAPKPIEQPTKATAAVAAKQADKQTKKTEVTVEEEDVFDPFEDAATQMQRMQDWMDKLSEQIKSEYRHSALGAHGRKVANATTLSKPRRLLKQEVEDEFVVLKITVPSPVPQKETQNRKIAINGYNRKLVGSEVLGEYDIKFRVDDGNLLSLSVTRTHKEEDPATKKVYSSVSERSFLETLRYPVHKLEAVVAEFDEAKQELTLKLPRDKKLEHERFGIEVPVRYR